jgi:hypothetical protein
LASGACKNQDLAENKASGSELWGRILSHPLTPHASKMRPTSTESSGSADAFKLSVMLKLSGLGGSRCALLNQALNSWGRLCANANPVGQTVLHDAQAFFAALGNRVVKPDALDKATIAANALVSHNDVKKWTVLRTAACKPDDDHDVFPRVEGTPTKVMHAQKVLAAVETLDMTTRPANCCKAFDYSPSVAIIEIFTRQMSCPSSVPV